MKVIQHSIKTFDFFGPKINFTIKSEANFKTVLGGLVSLIVYCLYILFWIVFGRDMLFRLNPNVTMESISPDNLEKIILTNKTFMAFSLSDLYGNFFEFSEFFQAELLYVYIDPKNRKNGYKLLSIAKCSENRFSNFFNGSNYNASDWYCLDFSKIYEKPLYLSWDKHDVFSSIVFGIDICKHEIRNNTKYDCFDYNKIKKFMKTKSIVINFIFHEVVFRPNNHTAPLEKRISGHKNILNFNLKRFDMVYFQKTTVEQDDNILFSQQEEIDYKYGINKRDKYSTFRTTEDFDSYYANDNKYYELSNNIYNFVIGYEQEYKKYTRKYMKVQDVFGIVSGFMEFLIFVFSMVNYYTNYRFDFYLFNEIVNVKVNKKENSICAFNNHRELFKVDKRKYIEFKDINKENKSAFKTVNENINSGVKENKPNSNDESSNRSISIFNIKNKADKFDEKNKEMRCAKELETDRETISQDVHSIKIKNKKYYKDHIHPLESNFIEKDSKDVISNLDNLNDQDRKENLNSVLSDLNKNKNLTEDNNDDINNNNYINKNPCLNRNDYIDLKDLEEILLVRKAERFLIPNCKDYYLVNIINNFTCCKNENQKKTKINLRLLNLYLEKINNKFEIFYYLKWLRDFKNLKELVLVNQDNKRIFKTLSESPFEARLNSIDDESIFKEKEANRNEIIKTWLKKIECRIEDNSFDDYVLRKILNITHKNSN